MGCKVCRERRHRSQEIVERLSLVFFALVMALVYALHIYVVIKLGALWVYGKSTNDAIILGTLLLGGSAMIYAYLYYRIYEGGTKWLRKQS